MANVLIEPVMIPRVLLESLIVHGNYLSNFAWNYVTNGQIIANQPQDIKFINEQVKGFDADVLEAKRIVREQLRS